MSEQGLPTPPPASSDPAPSSSQPSAPNPEASATTAAQDTSIPPSTEAPTTPTAPSSQASAPPSSSAASATSAASAGTSTGPGNSSSSLHTFLGHIVNNGNLQTLGKSLANLAHGRDNELCGLTRDGQDPLIILGNMAESTPASGWTVGVMYILPARLWYSGNAPPVPMSFIAEFCRRFDPTQARLVADRVTPLAKGIVYRAEALGNIKLAIPPLYNLLSRYAPSLSYLTTIHPIFLTACVQTKSYTAALPVLSTPITEISNSTTPSPYSPGSESASSQVPLSPDLTYQDHLIYHYLGGIALAALKKFKPAEEFFEICASAPVGLPSSSSGRNGGANNGGQGHNAGGASEGASGSGRGGAASRFAASSMNILAPMGRGSGGAGGGGDGGEGRGGGNGERGERGGEASMLQLDAMKKLVLVQLILYGQSKPPPRYTFPTITNSMRNSVYGAFAKAYPGPSGPLMQIVNKEGGVFDRDENAGLVKQALSRAPRWAIKKLTETYLTLGLREIGAAVGVGILSNATPVTGGDGGEGEGSGASKEVKWKAEDVDVEIVRGIVLDMIEHKEINASISADDTVTFADDIPLQVSKSDVDRALAEAQRQEALLREVEGALGRSRDWLAKAMRSRDEPGGLSTMMNTSNMGMQEDDLMSGIMGPGGSGTWDD